MVKGLPFLPFKLSIAHAHANCGPLQVFYDAASVGLTFKEIEKRAKALPEPLVLGRSRLVVHIQTSDAAIDDLLNLIRELAHEKELGGFVKPKPSRRDAVENDYVKANL